MRWTGFDKLVDVASNPPTLQIVLCPQCCRCVGAFSLSVSLDFSDSTGFCGWWHDRQKTSGMVQLLPPYCVERKPAQEGGTGEPPMGDTPLGVPCASAALDRESVDHPAPYRQSLSEMLHQYPALLPQHMAQGCPCHDADASGTQAVIVRRMKVQATGAVFSLRPSCVMPSMMWAHRGGRNSPLRAPVGGAVCCSGLCLWPRCPMLVSGLAGLRSPVAGRHHRARPAQGAPRSGGRCAAAPGRHATGLCPDHRGRRLCPGGCAWSRPPRRCPWRGARARVPRTPRP